MPFDWQLFIDVADRAAAIGDEAHLRTSVSRYYYASFGCAMIKAINHLGYICTASSADHGELVDCFNKSGFTPIAHLLENLRRWRNDCDYKAADFDVKATVTFSRSAAQDIQRRLLKIR